MHTHTHWTTDELLAHAQWLSDLARRLVADPAEADDIAQDTWLAALRSPPDRERAPRKWLATVARNFARMRRRSEAARDVRESIRERAPDELGPDELSARLEGQRLLLDAVDRLREPFRSTVLLAYFEHLTSEEIGRRQAVSASTVRWRLAAALAELRAELDRKHAGRDAWLLALAPLARSPEAQVGTALATAQGVLWMSMLSKWAVAATLLVCVAIVATKWDDFGIDARISLPSEPLAVTFAPIEPPPETHPNDAGERVEVDVQPDRELTTNDAAVALVVAAVEADFVDEAGRPIATIELTTAPRTRARVVDEDGGVIEMTVLSPKPATRADRPRALSDATGHVRLEAPLGPNETDWRLYARGRGWVERMTTISVRPGETSYLGTLVLARGGDIAGRVFDHHGQPLSGVAIQLNELDIPQSELEERLKYGLHVGHEPHALSGDDGTFVLSGAPVGMVRLVAGRRDFKTTISGPIEVRASQESRGVELVLAKSPKDELIQGIVLDPDGKPVARAKVRYTFSSSTTNGGGTLNSNFDGRFSIAASRGASHGFVATDPDDKWGAAQLDDVEADGTEIVLRLTTPIEVEVFVRSTYGRAIEHFRVAAIEPSQRQFGGVSSDGPHVDGRARINPKLSRFALEVRAPGFDLEELGPFDGAPGVPLEFKLRPLPGLRGRVVSNHVGVGGARIEIYERDGERHEKNGLPMRFNPTSCESVVCGLDGSFECTLRKSGDFVMLAFAEGFAASELEVNRFEREVGRADLELELVRGGAIEGRVLAPNGRSAAGTIVAFSRGDGRGFTQRVGPSGSFRADGLTPGRWDVRTTEAEIRGNSSSIRSWSRGGGDDVPWNCVVIDGEATRVDLDVGGVEPVANLTARVSVDGIPATGWTLTVQHGELGYATIEGRTAKFDLEGRVKVPLDQLGAGFAVITAIGGELDGLRFVKRLNLEPGEQNFELALKTVRVEVEHAITDGMAVVVWSGDDGVFALRGVPNVGVSELTVPAGRLKLSSFVEDETQADPRAWPALAEVTVAPGGNARLDAVR